MQLKPILEQTSIQPEAVVGLSEMNAGVSIINNSMTECNPSITYSQGEVVNIADFMKRKFPEQKPWLGKFIPAASLVMIHAQRGIGKTQFALSCALALAKGESFLKWEVLQPRKVLYLDGEMPGSMMQQRIRMLSQGEMPDKDMFAVFSPDTCEGMIPDIAIKEGRDRVEALIAEYDPEAIFLDNKSTFARDMRENDGDDWAQIQDWLINLRRTGKTIVMIHHQNKAGKQRGSSRTEDVFENSVALSASDDAVEGDASLKLKLEFKKHRNMWGEDIRPLDMNMIQNEEGHAEWSYSFALRKYDRCIEMLKRTGQEKMKQIDIAAELDVANSTITAWKKKAEAEGIL